MARMYNRRIGAICGAIGLGFLCSQAMGTELVRHGAFDVGYGDWWLTQNLMRARSDGRLCVEVPAGTRQAWDATVGQDHIKLNAGERYVFSLRASGDPAGPVRAVIQMPRAPYTDYVEIGAYPAANGKLYSRIFTSPVDTDDANLVIQLGGSGKAWTFCLDDVSVRPETEAKAAAAEEAVAKDAEPANPEATQEESVRCVQERVLALGQNPGPLDGLLGRRTSAAASAVASRYNIDVPALSGDTAAEWCAALDERLGSVIDRRDGKRRVGDYTIINNDWGAQPPYTRLVMGKDYTQKIFFDPASLQNGVSLIWDYPNYKSPAAVWGYPEILWGSKFGTGTNRYIRRVGDIEELKVRFDLEIAGETNKFSVLMELWTTRFASLLFGTQSAEVGVEVHTWWEGWPGKRYMVGTVPTIKSVHRNWGDTNHTLVGYTTDNDYLSGTIDFAPLLADLVAEGIVSEDDYVGGIELGVEPTRGYGSLRVNTFEVEMVSR